MSASPKGYALSGGGDVAASPQSMSEARARSILGRPLVFGDRAQLDALSPLNRCCDDAERGCYDMMARCSVCRMWLCEQHAWFTDEAFYCEEHAPADAADARVEMPW